MTYPNLPAANAATTAYAASLVVKATPGVLFGVTFYNSKGSAQWIQVHDSATLPAENAVPLVILKIPSDTSAAYDFGERGCTFTHGIVICNSSTGPTKTIGSADCWITAQYV